MHIALVTMGLAPFDTGGPSTVGYHLIKELLKKKNIKITLFVGSSATRNQIIDYLGDEFENLFRWSIEKPIEYYLKRITKTYKSLSSDRPNILHVNNFYCIRTFYFPFIAKILGIPSVYTVHGLMKKDISELFNGESFQRFKSGLVESFYDFEKIFWSKIVACSFFSKQFMVLNDGIDEKNISVIHHGIDLDRINEAPKVNLEGEIKILYVGNLIKGKGVQLILKAISYLNDDIKNRIKLYIVGKGPYENYLKSLTSFLNLNKYTEFFGQLSLHQCYSMYKSCDILVVPSKREDFPMVILEGLGAGIPIIATKVGGIPEIIENGKNGLLTNFNSIGIAKKITYLVNNPKIRKNISDNNLKKAKQHSWSCVAEKYISIYRSFYT